MDSLKGILFVLAFFGVLFLGTLYLYQIDRSLAAIFNLVYFGAFCAFLAYGKQSKAQRWVGSALDHSGALCVQAIPNEK